MSEKFLSNETETDEDGEGGDSPETPDALTEEDYDRIHQYLQNSPEDRTPTDLVPEDPWSDPRRTETDERGPLVRSSGEEVERACKKIRDHMAEATTAREVVEAFPDLHTSAIMRHAYGGCHCSHSAPETSSPQLRSAECREFRESYSDGYSVSRIAGTWGRSENTATRHIFGRCSHEPTPRRTSPSEVEEEECRRLRETVIQNEKVGLNEVACGVCLRWEVAAFHLFGYCACDHGFPPVEESREKGAGATSD